MDVDGESCDHPVRETAIGVLSVKAYIHISHCQVLGGGRDHQVDITIPDIENVMLLLARKEMLPFLDDSVSSNCSD